MARTDYREHLLRCTIFDGPSVRHLIRKIHALYIARVIFHSCREVGMFESVPEIEEEINRKYEEIISIGNEIRYAWNFASFIEHMLNLIVK